MSKPYNCPHHGTDCYDTADDLGNFCELAHDPNPHHVPVSDWLRCSSAAVIEQVEWWLAELGRVTSGRISKVAYALEWQLCRAATWLRDEDHTRH